MQVFSHINGLCLWECTVYSESGFAASKGLLLNLDEVLPTQELRCKSIFICNWCPTLKEYRSCRAVMSRGGICFCAVKIWVMVGESRKILTVSICTDFVGYYYYKAKLFIVFPFSVLWAVDLLFCDIYSFCLLYWWIEIVCETTFMKKAFMKSIEEQNLDFSDKEFSAKVDMKIMNMREQRWFLLYCD